MKNKNLDHTYGTKSIKTAVKNAIKDGMISIPDDMEEWYLDGMVEQAKETGRAYDYWKMDNGDFFRFQIEKLEDFVYIDIGYHISD